MRKSLATLVVSLLLCGGATAAVVAADQAPSKPVRLAMVMPSALRIDTQAPPAEGGRDFPNRARGHVPMNNPAEWTARLQRVCQDRYARSAGMLAYLEARLELNPQQGAAFERWRTVQLDAAKRQAAACASRPDPRGVRSQNGGRNVNPRNAQNRPVPPSPVERMTREENRLQQRLAEIQAERPALEALYNSLTPAQRERFATRGAGMMMGRRSRFMGNGMHGGPMGRGMPPQGGPNGPGRQGPPPAPQP